MLRRAWGKAPVFPRRAPLYKVKYPVLYFMLYKGGAGQLKEGVLIYDQLSERYDIRYGQEEYYGGLHCGDCFEVLIRDEWKPTRIEMSKEWYLVGIDKDISLSGLKVRI